MIFDKFNGITDVIGIIGTPISHTFSPTIHNTIAHNLFKNFIYVPFHVENNNLEVAVNGAYALNVKALNVTIPHKVAVFDFLESVDVSAKNVGAVNTLKRGITGFVGYNTDYIGIIKAFSHNDISLFGKTVVVLGAGGAARAACYAAAFSQCKEIIIVNRSNSSAENLKKFVSNYFFGKIQAFDFDSFNKTICDLNHETIAIQCTPVGTLSDKSPIDDDIFFNSISCAFDTIYNPWETKFLSHARRHKKIAINGFQMLVFQAIAAYEIWFEEHLGDQLSEKLLRDLTNYYKN